MTRRTTGLVWFLVALGSIVPGGLIAVPVFLVMAIVATWGRPRTVHLWLAASLCQAVVLVQWSFGGSWTDWLVGALLGGFPALSVGLALWMLADRERSSVKTLPRSA